VGLVGGGASLVGGGASLVGGGASLVGGVASLVGGGASLVGGGASTSKGKTPADGSTSSSKMLALEKKTTPLEKTGTTKRPTLSKDLGSSSKAVHSVCNRIKRKPEQRHRSNPAVKLLSMAEDGSVIAPNEPISDQTPIVADSSDDLVLIVESSKDIDTKVGDSDTEILDEVRGQKRVKVSYEKRRKFQESWVPKHLWSQQNLGIDGYLVSVKCRTCSQVYGRDILMGPKDDTLSQHQGRRKALKDMPRGIKKNQYYVEKNCRHLKAERVLAACIAKPINVQVTIVKRERAQKRQQMETIFHLLQRGRPMIEYEALQSLFTFLKVPTLPNTSRNEQLNDCVYEWI
jgi:hypothetical protein